VHTGGGKEKTPAGNANAGAASRKLQRQSLLEFIFVADRRGFPRMSAARWGIAMLDCAAD
jgi:hypothetical protein